MAVTSITEFLTTMPVSQSSFPTKSNTIRVRLAQQQHSRYPHRTPDGALESTEWKLKSILAATALQKEQAQTPKATELHSLSS